MAGESLENVVVALVEPGHGEAGRELVTLDGPQPQPGVGRLHVEFDQNELARRLQVLAVSLGRRETGGDADHPAAAVVLPRGDDARRVADQIAVGARQTFQKFLRRQPGLGGIGLNDLGERLVGLARLAES